MSDGVSPLDDAIHDVAGVVLLVGAKRLEDQQGMLQSAALRMG